jgi:steroid 5-alpha reductase family enzyme
MILLPVAGFGLTLAVMLVLWRRQEATRNATSVDVAWSWSVAGLFIFYGLFADGDPVRRALVAALGAGWGGRLGWYLWSARVRMAEGEDGRYAALRREWGTDGSARFFRLYVAQAVAATLCSLPGLAAMRGGPVDGWVAAGVAVWLVAVAGESLADAQLGAFRADPANRGGVCQVGLWRYSRHPNYFFEWLHWWSYVFIAQGAWLTWLGPIGMLWLLTRVTGIPHTERQALRSRGDAYRAYVRTTSAFIPWPPRREA